MNILQFLCAVCLFVSLPACVAYGQPSWYQNHPENDTYYYGVGSSTESMDNAENDAFSDLIQRIHTNITVEKFRRTRSTGVGERENIESEFEVTVRIGSEQKSIQGLGIARREMQRGNYYALARLRREDFHRQINRMWKEIQQRVDYGTSSLPPILSIAAISFSEAVLDAEERAALNIRIKNVGLGDARNVSIELSGVGVSQGLSFPASTKVPTIAKAGGEQVVEIPIIGEHALPTGMASLDIHVIEPQFKQKIRGKRLRFQTRAFRAPQLVMADVAVVEYLSATPNNRIDLNEQINLKFYVQNRGVGAAEDVSVSVKVENDQKGVEWLGVTNAEGTKKISPKFSAIDAGEYELVTYSYFVNSEFAASELRFTIRTTERHGQYGFVETKTAAINTELESLGPIAALPRDEDPAPERVQIEDLQDLEIDVRKKIDVRQDIPRAAYSNSNAVGVVIGIAKYADPTLPPVKYAKHDAQVVREYLVKTFGYDPKSILPRDPNQLMTAGTLKTLIKNRLPAYVKKGKSDVFIYYSGHGAPKTETQQGFLVPYDCDPNHINTDNAYRLQDFREDLSRIESRSLTVVLDACFSGMTGDGQMLIRNISPILLRSLNISTLPTQSNSPWIVLTSTAQDRVSNWYPEKQHSMFTYFFLKGLQGAADLNRDRRITVSELEAYLINEDDGVPYWSNRIHGRRQTPQVETSDSTMTVVELQ